ncbi:hypothetical protein SAMN05428966_101308 [Massilia sp. PDC64]|nr:hypothetical protein [Massilia sp. PDC64]SDC21761.1 hypothetical protein SAMN05428966_101308 [Massilia sp. PDC64]
MKLRLPKRQPGTPGAEAALVHLCEMLDRCIPILRTVFLIIGVLAAALRGGWIADFLFATGLLLQFVMWFDYWWVTKRVR